MRSQMVQGTFPTDSSASSCQARTTHLIVLPMILHHVAHIINEVSRQSVSFLFWKAGFCLQVWGERNQDTETEVFPPALFELPSHRFTPSQTMAIRWALPLHPHIQCSSAPGVPDPAYDTIMYQCGNYLKGKSPLFESQLGKGQVPN